MSARAREAKHACCASVHTLVVQKPRMPSDASRRSPALSQIFRIDVFAAQDLTKFGANAEARGSDPRRIDGHTRRDAAHECAEDTHGKTLGEPSYRLA